MNFIEQMTKGMIGLSRKTAKEYIQMAHPVRLRWYDDGRDAYYVASIPSLPACVTHGYTVKEALREVMVVKQLTIETMMKHNQPVVEFAETTPVVEIAEPFSQQEIKEMEEDVEKMIGLLGEFNKGSD